VKKWFHLEALEQGWEHFFAHGHIHHLLLALCR
jgi:hypothetical protein